MNRNRILLLLAILPIVVIFDITIASAQRFGGLPREAISNRLLISNGPNGPIHGGESAVTDMMLMDDGWVYGSTKATWGADNCHLLGPMEKKLNMC